MLVVRAWAGYPDEAISGISIPSEHGMAGVVYRSGAVHHFADVQNEAVYEAIAHSGSNHIRSSLGVPLHSNQQVLGVLFADNFSRTAAFNEEDERLLLGLAVQISMLIQNVQLFEQLIAEREQTRHLARQVIEAQENERRRVSRELHDEAGQALVLLKQGLQRVQRETAGDFERVRQRIDDSIALSDQTMERVRSLAYNLRPPLLDTVGLSTVLEEYCQEFAGRTGMVIEYSSTELPTLSDSVRITLYRFLQEALTNVVKHAEADRVRVILDYTDGTVSLLIEDNGDGFDSHIEMRPTKQQKGIGLVGIQERVRAVNGRLEVVSEPGNGTQLTVYIPVENKT